MFEKNNFENFGQNFAKKMKSFAYSFYVVNGKTMVDVLLAFAYSFFVNGKLMVGV